MEMLKFHGQFLKKYSTEESSLLDSTEYIIQQVESRDTDRVIDLLKQKYEFHERFLFMEIVLKATEKERNKVKIDLPGIFFKMSYEYTEDLYKLAYDSFEADRRFHLEQQFDQSKAKYVKESYINRCREQGMPVFSAHKDKELLGYIIIDLHPNRENNCFQIMLGVTKSGIKGKMIAFPL